MDREFFVEYANKYKDMLYRIALNYFRNPYDADDMVQDVLLKFYETDKSFTGDEHVRNWLIRVMINQCRNTLRLPWRKRNVSLDELSGSVEFACEEQSGLFKQVMNLPEKYRVILYLFYYEEFSVKEISSLLKISESAVTTRLSRARKKLKDNILEVTGDERYEII